MSVVTSLLLLRGILDILFKVYGSVSPKLAEGVATDHIFEGHPWRFIGRHQRLLASIATYGTEALTIDFKRKSKVSLVTDHMPGPSKACQALNFEVGFEFTGADLLKGARNSQATSAEACCQRCEILGDCTHWSWTPDSVCSIRHGKLARTKNTGKTIISGRVSLNSYVERVHNQDVVKQGAASIADCKYHPEDAKYLQSQQASTGNSSTGGNSTKKPTSYIVINEPRSGSSWLQEISQMHPGILVQFELDLAKGDAALRCMQCSRPKVPASKNISRLPPKQHPPQACGMTLFGSSNRFRDVEAVASRHNASLVILLRRNHVAHAVSIHRHFNGPTTSDGLIPWDSHELARSVDDAVQGYHRLLSFAARAAAAGRPVHVLFYEDMNRRPREAWAGLQAFLDVPAVEVKGIEHLERKSSNRPSVEYLKGLQGLRADPAVAAAEWAMMLNRTRFDEDGFEPAAAFEDACRRHPRAGARLTWRGGACEENGGNVVK